MIDNAVDVGAKLLSLPEGQRENVTDDRAIRNILGQSRTFGLHVVVVLDAALTAAHAARRRRSLKPGRGGVCVADRLRPGEVTHQHSSGAETLFALHLQRVIDGAGMVRKPVGHVAIVRVRPAALAY